jgi:hypothetical protein
MTAVGMLVAGAVRRVRITFADGTSTTVQAEPLGPALRRSAGLRRLRYAAFSVRGTWCAERVVSLSGRGRVLWDSGTDDLRCSANGSPT